MRFPAGADRHLWAAEGSSERAGYDGFRWIPPLASVLTPFLFSFRLGGRGGVASLDVGGPSCSDEAEFMKRSCEIGGRDGGSMATL